MNSTYAGFGLRLVAYIIDAIIIYVAQAFVVVPLLAVFGISFASQIQDPETMSDAEAFNLAATVMAFAGTAAILTAALGILYGALMESSKYQGTLGKLALGLSVTDMDGNKLDFVKSLVRNLSKILSGMILWIGFIIAAFTEKKQGLHDIIAGTLVYKK
jgi:uncharacterized RDD family membrane protein YckC